MAPPALKESTSSLASPSNESFQALLPYSAQPSCYSALMPAAPIPSPIPPMMASVANGDDTFFRFDAGLAAGGVNSYNPAFPAASSIDGSSSPVVLAYPPTCVFREAPPPSVMLPASPLPSAPPMTTVFQSANGPVFVVASPPVGRGTALTGALPERVAADGYVGFAL